MWVAGERTQAFVGRIGVFCVGVLTGASGIAFAAHAAGSSVWRSVSTTLIVAVALVSALHEGSRRKVRLPDLGWQVPREWMRHFWAGAFAFGAIMGAGVFTRTLSMTFYLYLVLCAFSATAGVALAMGLAYGGTYVAAFLAGTIAWRSAAAGAHADGMIRIASALRPVVVLSAVVAALVAALAVI